jgi:hypothetical protein
MKNFHDYLQIIQERTENIPSGMSDDDMKKKMKIAQEIFNKVKSDGFNTWSSITRSEVFSEKEFYGVQDLKEDDIYDVLDMVDEMFDGKIFKNIN